MAMATTSPARQPRLMKEMPSTMITASNKPRVNPDTASSTTSGWSETRKTSTPIGRFALILSSSWSSAAPNSSRLAPGLHADGEPDGRLAVVAEQIRRRIDIAAPDGRHIGQPEEAVVDAQVDVSQALFRAELPLTRTKICSGPACTAPEGVTAFCAASVLMIAGYRRPAPRSGGWRIRDRSPRPARRSDRRGRHWAW